jgi:hypothetical protein
MFLSFLLVLLSLLLLFVFLSLDAVALLHLTQAQWIRYQRLVKSLPLLLGSEQWVFTDLGCNVTSGVAFHSDEILVRSTNLCK